ncbi:ABC transporter permease, partial [Butyricicoccus sp. 1XD8-22]
RGNITKVLIPLVAGVVFFILWEIQFFHTIFQLKTYQLPLPSVIIEAIRENFNTLVNFMGYTFAEAFFGMLIGSSLGFLVALLATASPKWGKGGLTIVVALNAVPIVALAPIMNLWFGNEIGSRIAIVTVTTMAAMALNAHKGMSNVNPLSLDLLHSYAANKVQVFRYLRIANSLPYVFTALKINATASMIGAIVGEFFYASKGLGYLLSNSIKVAQMPLGWACIVIASIVGVVFYLIIELLEKIFMRWHPSERA